MTITGGWKAHSNNYIYTTNAKGAVFTDGRGFPNKQRENRTMETTIVWITCAGAGVVLAVAAMLGGSY